MFKIRIPDWDPVKAKLRAPKSMLQLFWSPLYPQQRVSWGCRAEPGWLEKDRHQDRHQRRRDDLQDLKRNLQAKGVCVYVYVCVYICVYIYIYHTYLYVYKHISIYKHVCACIYILCIIFVYNVYAHIHIYIYTARTSRRAIDLSLLGFCILGHRIELLMLCCARCLKRGLISA